MKINSICLGGFRNIKKSVFEFDDIIAMIATNNYGKSNILTGIKFGIDFINCNEKNKDTMMKWTKGIPVNKELALEDYQIGLNINSDIDGEEYVIQYGFKFRWFRNDGTGQKIIDEYLKYRKKEDKKFSIYISRNENEACYKSSDTGRCNTKININTNELVVNKLKAFDNLYYIKIINLLNSIKLYIERHLDASHLYGEDPFVRVDADKLDMENSENIPRMIYYLKNDYKDKYELLKNSFMSLFPEIKDVRVEELKFKYDGKFFPEDIPFKLSNELYRIMVFDRNLNQPISFENMSDGAKRIFLQLATIIISEIQGYSIVAIEEPENSLHPSLFQSYLRTITQFKGDCRIIITSHSPYLIRYFKTDNIYVGIPNDKGIAIFSRMKKSSEKQLEKISNQFNMSIGDYIFELLNGDDEDVDDLKKMTELVEV